MDKKGKLLSKRFTTPEDRENKINIQALISSAVLKQKELKKLENEAKNNKYVKGFFAGEYNDSNLRYYIKGVQALKVIVNGGLGAYEAYLSSGSNPSKKQLTAQVITSVTKQISNSALESLIADLNSRYEKSRNVYMFEQMCKFMEDGRDIVSEEVQRDDIKTQRNMSTRDIFYKLQDLVDSMGRDEKQTIDFYVSLGTDAICFIGAMTQLAREDKKGLVVMSGLNAISNMGYMISSLKGKKKWEKIFEEGDKLLDEVRKEERNFLSITPTNKEDLKRAKNNAIQAKLKRSEWETKVDKLRNKDNLKSEIVFLAMMGVITASELSKCEGKVNPSTMSKIMLKIMNNRKILNLGIKSINKYNNRQKEKDRYKNDLETVLHMAEQIEEKSDALSTPTGEITSVEFKDFRGEFYKSQVGEEEIPECVINIPSMKLETGKVVLLTGNSGSGKSTILKFLRDGDIGNKGQIIVNGTDRVDKLGRDIVSMCEAKMNLCSYNALQDITGKVRMKDLTKEERAKLKDILFDLGLSQDKTEKDEFISKCEYKTYEQFSTGQQKRLELAKALFSINDNSQVVLLDETVSNIQRELGEGAFKLINKYTKKGKPKIVVMVSHNIEMASIYADKRYHIDENHTLVEMPVRKTELELE